jgi:hypothetical protein
VLDRLMACCGFEMAHFRREVVLGDDRFHQSLSITPAFDSSRIERGRNATCRLWLPCNRPSRGRVQRNESTSCGFSNYFGQPFDPFEKKSTVQQTVQ